MSSQGPNKIAQRLTEQSVPTPRGGAKWYPTTVSDVLKRANQKGRQSDGLCTKARTIHRRNSLHRQVEDTRREASHAGRVPYPQGGERLRVGGRARPTRGNDFDPKAGGITFRAAAQAWLNSRSNDLKETTAAGYRRALAPVADRRKAAQRLSIDAMFGGYPLNAIKREQITAWVAEQKAAGKSPVTIRHAVLLVKVCGIRT
jgi:Recombinase